MSPLLAPSILSADFSRLGEEITCLEAAGADWIHLDVMDGHFVPNLTFGPPVIASLRKTTRLPFDVHLMVDPPELLLEDFLRAGSDRVTVHAEGAWNLHRTVHRIRSLGAKAGVSLNPATPLSLVEPILPDLDQLLLMTVNPGFGGQVFIPSVLPKIRAARERIAAIRPEALLQVDGGITLENLAAVVAAGATVIVAGAAIMGSPDYGATIRAMKACFR
jgi:ribulose-phosphate 3-epimerase